jgi:hypothetical protein
MARLELTNPRSERPSTQLEGRKSGLRPILRTHQALGVERLETHQESRIFQQPLNNAEFKLGVANLKIQGRSDLQPQHIGHEYPTYVKPCLGSRSPSQTNKIRSLCIDQ